MAARSFCDNTSVSLGLLQEPFIGEIPTCTMPYVNVVVVLVLLTCVKLFIVVVVFLAWRLKYKASQNGNSANQHERSPQQRLSLVKRQMNRRFRQHIPFVPIFVTLQLILYVVITIATALAEFTPLNNALPAAFAAWTVFLFTLYASFHLRLFIKLGLKVIPIARTDVSETGRIDQKKASAALKAQSGVIVAAQYGIYLVTTLQLVLGTLVAPLRPVEEFSLWFRAILGCIAFMTLFFMIAFAGQIERIIAAIKIGAAQPWHEDIKKTLTRLRWYQTLILLASIFPVTLSLLIAAGIVSAHYYLILAVMAGEAFGSMITIVGYTIPMIRKEWRKERVSSINDSYRSTALSNLGSPAISSSKRAERDATVEAEDEQG